MNPETDAIPVIEANLSKYALSWKNKGRISDDWKVKLYEQDGTRLQLAIYNRKATAIRLERLDVSIVGVTPLDKCSKSDALKAKFSHFKDGSGICVAVEDVGALERLLEQYFAPATFVTKLDSSSTTLEHERAAAHLRKSIERRQRLAKAPVKPRQSTVQTTVYDRNHDVIDEVLERAAGKCESCKSDAPFLTASTGEPYLEVHHIVRLADEGEDTIENAIALCPNCHRQAHYG